MGVGRQGLALRACRRSPASPLQVPLTAYGHVGGDVQYCVFGAACCEAELNVLTGEGMTPPGWVGRGCRRSLRLLFWARQAGIFVNVCSAGPACLPGLPGFTRQPPSSACLVFSCFQASAVCCAATSPWMWGAP